MTDEEAHGHYEKVGDIEEWRWDEGHEPKATVPEGEFSPLDAAPEADEADEPVFVEDAPDDAPDVGTGPYEDRTLAQLKALAESRDLPTYGTKADLAERLRG